MMTSAHPDGDVAGRVRDRTTATLPITRRQSAEAIGLLLGLLLVLVTLAVAFGTPAAIGA